MNHIIWNQNEVNIDETFTYNIVMNMVTSRPDITNLINKINK